MPFRYSSNRRGHKNGTIKIITAKGSSIHPGLDSILIDPKMQVKNPSGVKPHWSSTVCKFFLELPTNLKMFFLTIAVVVALYTEISVGQIRQNRQCTIQYHRHGTQKTGIFHCTINKRGFLFYIYRKNSKYWDTQTSYRSCP